MAQISGGPRRAVGAAGVALSLLAGTLALVVTVAPEAVAAQPKPNHTGLVPEVPRKDTPKITNGEIWDIEVVGSRAFVAGSFTSIADASGTTTPLAQPYLAAFDLNTGKIDRNFRPSFGGGGVNAVEASPNGSALYVVGSFNTVNGVSMKKVARLDPTTGAPVTTFKANANSRATSLAVSASWVYVGGQFTTVNGTSRVGLAAVNPSTGAVDTGFNLPISGGVGVNGALTVQQLKLTHDDSKLLVVHTGRKIAGQDRLAVGLIDTATKTLLPWRTRLWDDNLARAGGVTRVYAADISPDDSYFVVTSGSGGDLPPISDTVVAYPVAGNDNVQPMWIARCFDSIYSVAITEKAVYIGGHFQWNESPTANQPWPGLDNVGYGTGQGLSAYSLGDQVVRRDHLGALDPVTGTALEWDPGSDSYEGNKAMEATPRGLITGGDASYQGGVRTGRIAFFDLNTLPAASTTNATITAPIKGRVVRSGEQFTITGTATNPVGIKRVQVEIQDRGSKRYLQDDLVTWGAANTINATLGSGTTSRSWQLPVTITGSRKLLITAKTFGSNGVNSVKVQKRIESFNFDDATPNTSITGPSGIQTSTSIRLTGTASDDHGVNSVIFSFRDANNQYLQSDGSVSAIYNTFRGVPDVVGAAAATWSYDVTLPHEGVWTAAATAVDTAGQADLREADRTITINSNAVAPTVSITQPVAMTPPFTVPAVVLAPGGTLRFAGRASDDNRVTAVAITLRNTTTRENLGADGTWGVGVSAGSYTISPPNLSVATYDWSYTTPFTLKAGTYTFSVKATDNDDITTASSNQGRLTLTVQVPGDSPPASTITVSGTQVATSAHLDLTGTATDDKGVKAVEVLIYDNDTGRYLQDNLTMASGYNTLSAALSAPNTTATGWSLPVDLPGAGDYSVTVFAYDSADQQATSAPTARYRYYPGDAAPTLDPALASPSSGTAFNQGRIVVTGRANDDKSIARVEVGVVDSLGRYLNGSGIFSSTAESWRTAFLNSPGSPGSNFSYTTPVIPDGTYQVLVRATDQHNQIGPVSTATGIVVTHPANNAPVAKATVSCVVNSCTFDGRTSTDENPAALSYAWNFGNGTTGTGPVPVRLYTTAGTFPVTLTVTDEWGLTATTSLSVTITEPAGNRAPNAVFAVSCLALSCSTSSAGTVDPDPTGDSIVYTWSWGDGTATTTGAAGSHTYAAQGTYTVTMTATDGWGKAAVVTKQVTMSEPVTNTAPSAAFSAVCVGLTCTMYNTTTDPQGDAVSYSWTFGDGTTSTAAQPPPKTYAAAGTYTVTLTATDGWNKSVTITRSVVVTP